jgi:membrane associated rhomboid family serine protease
MTPAPVGIRCPEHSGKAQGLQRVTQGARRAAHESVGGYVTKALIAINVAVFLLELAAGGTINGIGSRLYEQGALYGPAVAAGDWWRLISAAFLHYGPIHLGMNMLALWWFGQPLEHALGRGRFLLLYLVSGLAGSAGALIVTPLAATVGASGAIFGILGAALIMERQGSMVFGGQAMTMIVINLVFTFAVPGISWGGHVGGLVGGALCMLALSRFGRGHAAYGRPGAVGIAGLVAIGVLSVAVSYWKVRGYV